VCRGKVSLPCPWSLLFSSRPPPPRIHSPSLPPSPKTQAFKDPFKDRWKNRTLEFSGTDFKLSWTDGMLPPHTKKVFGTFQLNPLDVDFGPCEEHHKPFEVKVVSAKDGVNKTFFFCTESADDQNTLITRMDAARRLHVASVSGSGTVFNDESTTLQMALETRSSGPVNGAKAFSWGLGDLLGVEFKSKMDGMSIPHRLASLTPACVPFLPPPPPQLSLCAPMPCPPLNPSPLTRTGHQWRRTRHQHLLQLNGTEHILRT
jgi:hypothetical protein